MDILGQSALMIAVAAFALAVTALSRNMRNRLIVAYSVLCTVISGWGFFFFLEKIFISGVFYKIHLFFNLMIAPIGLGFIRVLTRVDSAFFTFLFRVSVVYSFILSALLFSSWADSKIFLGAAFFAPSFLAAFCLYLMYIDWQLKKGSIKRAKISTVGLQRRSWVYLGAICLLVMAVMDHVPLLGEVIPSIGNILLGLYLFLVSEAIIHQRLLNLTALLNRILVLMILSVCFTLLYAISVAWIEDAPALFILNSFMASAIIVMLVDPFKRLMSFSVTRIFSEKLLKYESSVESARMELTGVLDSVGLAELSISFLQEILKCSSITVFVLRSDGSKFRRLRGVGDESLQNREILANHPIIDFFIRMKRRGENPILLNHYLENEIDRSTSAVQRENYELTLTGLTSFNDSNIAIPFMDGNTVLGFVVMHVKEPPEAWGNNWGVLSAIYPFFTQAARTLKNMDVYVRLREKDRLATLGEMAAGLAHEIRNPLGAIKGASQLLQSASTVDQTELLRVIVEEVNRLNKVVTQFLDYSKPVGAEYVSYDVGVILQRTDAFFKSSIVPSDIKISLIEPYGGYAALPKLKCAPEQLKQVMVNLIQNAIQVLKEHPKEESHIRFGAQIEKSNQSKKREMVIFVEDNGPGISRENIEKIFIPFFTTSPQGTGLGLPICAKIVEAHGGTIDVVSEEGKFTRFLVRLPVA